MATPAMAVSVRVLDLDTNDIVYDPVSDLIYASVPSSEGFPHGNSIIPIDPYTGVRGDSVFAGSEPGTLALADDGSRLYVALNEDNTVRPFDLFSGTMESPFEIGPSDYRVEDMEVVPGHANSLAIARRHTSGSPYNQGVGIYVDGEKLPNDTGQFENRLLANAITFSDSPDILYGHDSGVSPHTNLITFEVDLSPEGGVRGIKTTGGVFDLWQPDIQFDAGRVYSSRGRVVDPIEHVSLGAYPIPWGSGGQAFVPDTELGRTFYVAEGEILIYDQPTFLLRREIPIPDFSGGAHKLIRWGDDGLAFRTDEEVYLLDGLFPTQVATWDGSNGDWNDSSNWDSDSSPDNGNGSFYHAMIDSGHATLAENTEVRQLTVGSATLSIAADATLSASESVTLGSGTRIVSRLGDASAGAIYTDGQLTLGPDAVLAFEIDASAPFRAGTYTILQGSATEGILGAFDSVEGLGAYVTDQSLEQTDDALTLTITIDLHPGDADLSAATDLSDFNVWNAHKFTDGTDWTAGDFNGDGLTDLTDFNLWNAAKFTPATGGATPAPTQVPEPSTLVLLACGLLASTFVVRRRRARSR